MASLHPSLTTTFSAPPACTDAVAYDRGPYSSSGTEVPLLQASAVQSSSCFAQGWTTPANDYARGQNYWSGTPMCPDGQYVAQTYFTSTTTTAICCSNSWGNVFSNADVYDGVTYSFYMCQTFWSTPATSTLSASITYGGIFEPASIEVTGPGAIESTAEYMFVYTVPLTSAISSPTTTSVLQTASPAPATTSSPPIKPSPGLGTGAIAGIVVGVLLLLAILAGFVLMRKRAKRQRRADSLMVPKDPYGHEEPYVQDKAELPTYAQYGHAHEDNRSELQTTKQDRNTHGRVELYSEPAELDGHGYPPAELGDR